MSLTRLLIVTSTTSVIGVATFAVYKGWQKFSDSNIRGQLPDDLDTWRVPGRRHEDEVRIWAPLYSVFRKGGLEMWPVAFLSMQKSPNLDLFPNGYEYVSSSRRVGNGIGTINKLRSFNYPNGSTRMARTSNGHDVAVRVLVIREEGYEHLKILRKIATGPNSLLSTNHALPLLSEFQFHDIIFGIFPKVGGTMEEAFQYWAKNSVGDVMDMLLQALEALAFIHASNIAHRDAFHDNFLVQWHPESMSTMAVPASRPRVYLIDFEVAVEFPSDCPPAERMSTGYPLGGSLPEPEMYSRPLAPEMSGSNKPYCPFKLDVWQLGNSFENFRTMIADIDEVIEDLTCSDPKCRMSANEALERLGGVVYDKSPASLLLQPHIIRTEN